MNEENRRGAKLRAIALIVFASVKLLLLLIILPLVAVIFLLRWLLYRVLLHYNLRSAGMDNKTIYRLLKW